jgi:prolyl 4-hydroxylase
MSVVIHFSKDLSAWLVEGMDEGRPTATLVQTMVEEKMAPGVAQAIVDAFLAARRAGRPVPVDAVTVDEEKLGYVNGAPTLRSENRVALFDRSVRVLARGSRPVWALFHSVMSARECAEVIELARPRLAPSTVVDPKTGRDVVADYRTSLGCSFARAKTSS